MTTSSALALLDLDLEKSGLLQDDLGAYVAQEAEMSAVGLKPHLYLGNIAQAPGYIIPYYDIAGLRAPFYRLKLFNPSPKGARYLQPSNVGSWIYFPKNFAVLLAQEVRKGEKGKILITEGEKKAAKACKAGFATCAVGGVYNWRNTTVIFPEGTELVKNRENQIVARIKGDMNQQVTSDRRGVLAHGLKQIIAIAQQYHIKVVIAFDSDNPVNQDVQKAAAELAFELRFNGIAANCIRQIALSDTPGQKVGLDDYLLAKGSHRLGQLLDESIASRSSYPAHPNLKEVIGRILNSRMERNEVRELALMVLTDMDRFGIRMVERATGAPYYFDNRTKVLMPASLLHHNEVPLHETKFGEYLYRQYDISQPDHKLLGWIAAGFTGEQPVERVDPSSVYTLNNGGLAYQIDDGHYVQISNNPDSPIAVHTNGSNGILFRAGQVEPIDAAALCVAVKDQIAWIESRPAYEEFFWAKAASEFKFLRPHDAKIMAVLSYISPWLQRWKGTQLPVELMIGEPGSGKSSMYSLRLEILTGRAALRNQPTDIRDWYASITSQSGMHVTDNVAFATKEIKQRISDEICRLVTEPIPTVEMRRLFTTSENLRIPVHVVFAMTAIQQPFVNADIMQRAVIMELSAIGDNHSSDWTGAAMKRHGGRIQWLAHQLAVLHVFFKAVAKEGGWLPDLTTRHRLANFEQLFQVMSGILNMPDRIEIQRSLSESSQRQVSDHDWTMEALKSFGIDNLGAQQQKPSLSFTCFDISTWAQDQEDFAENQVVTNPRRLARYIKSHQHMVESLAGLVEGEKCANRITFKVRVIS